MSNQIQFSQSHVMLEMKKKKSQITLHNHLFSMPGCQSKEDQGNYLQLYYMASVQGDSIFIKKDIANNVFGYGGQYRFLKK